MINPSHNQFAKAWRLSLRIIRCDKINSLFKKDRFLYKRAIFVHIDSRSKGHQTDVFFYHSEKNSESKHLAKTMKSTFAHKYKRHQPGRGFTGTVDGRGLYVLRHTTPPSVFVELGNIQNTYDQQRLSKAKTWSFSFCKYGVF